MNGIREFSDKNDKKILVLASVNKEINLITAGYSWQPLAGKKIKVFSLRESFENISRKGYPDDPLKFYVIWKKGEKEQTFFAQKIKFNGWAGSSFNIADHLVALGNKNVTLAAFVNDGPELNDLHQYCRKTGMKFVPLWASNTAMTFVFEDEDHSNSVVCMQKPSEIDTHLNKEKLNQHWDVIIASSVPANVEILNMIIDLFQKHPQAVKTVMPSLSLINSEDQAITILFKKLISLTTIFQVNDLEAGRYLNLNNQESAQRPIQRRQLVLDLVKELKVPVLIVTMGEWGAAVVITDLEGVAENQKYVHQGALKGWDIKSTVGSGDAFHAGFVDIFIQADDSFHHLCISLAARIGAEVAVRNAGVWGGNMSQEKNRLSPKELMEIVNKYRDTK